MQKRGAISPIANALPRQHTTTLAPRFCPSSKWNLQLSGRRRTGWRFTGRQWALFWTGCRRPNEPSLQPAPVTRVVPSARLYSKNIGSSDEFVGFLNMIVRKIRLAIYFRSNNSSDNDDCNCRLLRSLFFFSSPFLRIKWLTPHRNALQIVALVKLNTLFLFSKDFSSNRRLLHISSANNIIIRVNSSKFY